MAFSLKNKPEEKKKGGKAGSIKENRAKETSKKDDKKHATTGKNKKDKEEVINETPNYVFEVDKTVGMIHIEYELVPNKSKYNIDVKCWGPIAKIFTSDGYITLKTVIKNDMAWVPIIVEHYLETITIDEIKTLHDYVVKFEVSCNPKKIGKLCYSDKSKKFYSYAGDALLNTFAKVYEYDPNLKEPSLANDELSTKSVDKSIRFPNNDFVICLKYPESYDKIYDIIDKHCTGIDIECKDFVLACPPQTEIVKKVKISTGQETGKNKKKPPKSVTKPKKSETGKSKADAFTVSVPAEVFFTDPDWAIYKQKNDFVNTIYISVHVEHLLSTAQKLSLDPLVIKIKKLSNLPAEILKSKGVSSIYATYEIPFIANCKSIEKPVKEKIKFNESHIFFADCASKIKLIEFLQTRKLRVEIYGTKSGITSDQNPQLFGNEPDDEIVSKIQLYKAPQKTNTGKLPVLLAVCTYDISSIIENVWDFKEKGQCHLPGLSLYDKCEGFYDDVNYHDMRNVNLINIVQNYDEIDSDLTEKDLLTFGTTLKVEVYLMAPQTASLILLRVPNTFKRFLLILYDWEFAKSIVIDILKHNATLLTEDNITEYTDIITGFMIDHGNTLTIYVEGISTGFILTIEKAITTDYNTTKGKIFFNTDIVFEKRLYNSFLKEGICVANLRVPLRCILGDQRIYLEGNIPKSCLEALKKLCLLFYASSYKSILQYNLLPKPNEILSLCLEWGVPLVVKKDIMKM